jgi:hypothetical protein
MSFVRVTACLEKNNLMVSFSRDSFSAGEFLPISENVGCLSFGAIASTCSSKNCFGILQYHIDRVYLSRRYDVRNTIQGH